MKLFLISAYAVFFCSAIQTIAAIDFSLKGISSWIYGIKEETIMKETYFDFDGTVILENENGSIIIKSWSLPKIAIEATKKAPEKELAFLDLHMNVETHKATINAPSSKNNKYAIDYHIIVPFKTNLIVKNKGPIKIKNVEGAIKAYTESTLDIRGAVGSLTAQAQGNAIISYASLPLDTVIHVTSIKNDIMMALPKASNATLSAKTEFTMIHSEHFITLNPITVLLNKQTWSRLQKEVHGIIGNGGTQIVLTAYNGINIVY